MFGLPGDLFEQGSHLGLAGVRERAMLFGGRVDAGPRDAGGWRLRVAFPS